MSEINYSVRERGEWLRFGRSAVRLDITRIIVRYAVYPLGSAGQTHDLRPVLAARLELALLDPQVAPR